MSPVRFIPMSMDRKLSPVIYKHYGTRGLRPSPRAQAPFCSSTYVSIDATCPDICRFKEAGCYVRAGFTGPMARKLDEAAALDGYSGDAVAVAEAEAIDAAFGGGPIPQDGARGGRDLRLHVGGDVASATGARILAIAARRYRKRGGGRVWVFTHRWAQIPRSAWGKHIHVLASVESADAARIALELGYAPALVVDRHESDRAQVVDGVRFVPCPAETRSKTCVECRLCLGETDLASRRTGVSFAIHGNQAKRVRLPVVRSAA